MCNYDDGNSEFKQNVVTCNVKFRDLKGSQGRIKICRQKCHFGIADPALPIHRANYGLR